MKTSLPVTTLFVLLSAACGSTVSDDPSSGSSSSGETTDSDSDVSVTITASTTMTTMDSMSATGTTMTTDPTSTTDPTTETETDPTTTTDPDTSATDTDATSTDPSDTSGSSTDPGTSTGGGAVEYGPCDFADPENPTCPGEQICIVVEFGEFAGYHWCGIPCEGDADGCPENPDGKAVVECSGLGACALDCQDAECPDGMECNPIGSGDRCAWPGEG